MKKKKIMIILFTAVLLGVMSIAVAVVASPKVPTASEDPVGFISSLKGGESPNFHTEADTEFDHDKYIGPDGYEYFGDYYGGLFWIGARLSTLVSKEEYRMYTDEIFTDSFDFNNRSFCRYFSITEEQY